MSIFGKGRVISSVHPSENRAGIGIAERRIAEKMKERPPRGEKNEKHLFARESAPSPLQFVDEGNRFDRWRFVFS